MASENAARLAVLIDADNAQPAITTGLRNAIDAVSDDDGWASVARVGNITTQQRPDFDSRNYGFSKLSNLLAATAVFELDRRGPGDGKPVVIYARNT
jgi:OST-HTH/LOTUS domain